MWGHLLEYHVSGATLNLLITLDTPHLVRSYDMSSSTQCEKFYQIMLLLIYGKCSKIPTFLFLFSKKCWTSGLELTKCWSEKQTWKTLIRLLLQKQSDLGLPCLSRYCGRELLFKILDYLPYYVYIITKKLWKMI